MTLPFLLRLARSCANFSVVSGLRTNDDASARELPTTIGHANLAATPCGWIREPLRNKKSLVGSPAVAVMQDAMIVKGQTLARPQK